MSMPHRVTAIAFPNIAFIKYWGNRNPELHIPANGSISMNLGGLHSRTQVTFDSSHTSDQLTLNRRALTGPALKRVSAILNHVRQMSGSTHFARVVSTNNFPTGTGIASSASAFAALSLAASAAAGLDLSPRDLSRLARRGSGSACRSVPGGFVEWQAGEDDKTSYASSIAPPEHWDLIDCIAIVSQKHKPVGSIEGHALAGTSPLQKTRLGDAPHRLDVCRRAILERDFDKLAHVAELDSNLMHAAMMTSTPSLLYWQPATLAVMQAVQAWRKSGIPVFYTIDAGPNVHVLCPGKFADQVTEKLNQVPGVKETISAQPGGPAGLVTS